MRPPMAAPENGAPEGGVHADDAAIPPKTAESGSLWLQQQEASMTIVPIQGL